jgi:hypothetical protein
MDYDRRKIKRRKFGYYMQVIDNETHELVGYLSDISPQGFKLDTQKALPVNQEYTLRMDLTAEISEKSYIAFVARAMWKKPDPLDPASQIEGFQIIGITPYEKGIYQRIVEKYGKPESTW